MSGLAPVLAPLVSALVMFAPTILGLSGMAFGLLFGLLMRRRHPVEAVGLGQ